MKRHHLSLIPIFVVSGLVLAGCDQLRLPGAGETPSAPEKVENLVPPQTDEPDEVEAAELPVRPSSAGTETSIDWDAARRDLAARPIEEREGAFQVASGEAAPAVPVFLPSAPVTAQGGEAAVRFQPLNDGYYAFIPGEAYDVIVNGTNKVIAAPGEDVQARGDNFRFQPSTTGAQVSFSRYGADYLVEFECKELTNGLPTCITEDEATSFAKDLVISGTR